MERGPAMGAAASAFWGHSTAPRVISYRVDRSFSALWPNFAPRLTHRGGLVLRPDHPDNATLSNNPAPSKLADFSALKASTPRPNRYRKLLALRENPGPGMSRYGTLAICRIMMHPSVRRKGQPPVRNIKPVRSGTEIHPSASVCELSMAMPGGYCKGRFGGNSGFAT